MNDRPQFIQREFSGFAVAVGLTDAPEIQKREMRGAFFAGARAYSNLVMKHAEPGDEPTPADMAFMEALEVELDNFIADVKEGRA